MFRSTNITFRILWNRPMMSFAKVDKRMKDLDETLNKVRRKQSVADVKKLQGYLEQAKQNKNLNIDLTRSANYDKEFNDFLNQYKEKNKEFTNIIDLSHYNQSQKVHKTEEQRREELVMLEEFRKRKQERTFGLISDDEDNLSDDEGRKSNLNDEGNFNRFSKEYEARDTERLREEILDEKMRTYYAGEKFMLLLLDKGVTTNVTTLKRINHFRYLVFMGNCNGVVGIGKGKGGDFQTALTNAIHECKKSLIAISLDHFYSLTTPVYSKFNGLKLTIETRQFMNGWGNPIMAYFLMLAGITNCRFHIVARNTSNYNLVYAFVKALVKCKTPKDLAEGIGYKIYHQNYTSWQYSNERTEIIPNSGPSVK